MKNTTAILLLSAFISGAAVAAPLYPILPQFKGMTIQNQCGKHGAQAGTKFCAESNGGYTSPGGNYLDFYGKECAGDGRNKAAIDKDMAVRFCKMSEKNYRLQMKKTGH